MTDRARVAQKIQVAVEATEGTDPGSGYKNLPSMQIMVDQDASFNKYRPSGNKYNTVVIQGQEWTVGKVSGPITYGEVVFALSSIVNYAAPSTANSHTTWTFTPSSAAQDVSKSYSIEWGESGAVYKALGTFFNELTLKFTRNAVELDGGTIGRRIIVGNAFTGSATDVENIPVSPATVDLYYSYVSLADLANQSNKLSRGFEAQFKLGKRFAPFWALDSTQTSFSGRVEDVPDASFSLRLGADTSGSDFVAPITLVKLRAGETIYFRIRAEGGQIPGTSPSVNYLMTVDLAFKVTKAVKFEDIDGALLGLGWDGDVVHDAIAAKAFQIVVKNDTASL